MRTNDRRLKAQAQLAQEHVSPLPSQGSVIAALPTAPFLKNTPQGQRFSEIEALEGRAMGQLRSRASGVELQGLIDDWAHSPEGEALLKEKRELLEQAVSQMTFIQGQSGLVAEPPELPPGASPARIAQHAAETKRIRLLREILSSVPPGTTPFETQALIDSRRSELDALTQEAASLQPQIARESLESWVSTLQREAQSAGSIISNPGAGKKP